MNQKYYNKPIYIGITGSKGKSTIAFLINHCLLINNYQVMLSSGTEGKYYNGKRIELSSPLNYLNPENKRLDFFISEATSFLLKQKMYDNVKQTMSIYTGVDKYEHTEGHEDINDYVLSKKKLADNTIQEGLLVVNNDDKYSSTIISDFKGKVVTIGDNKDKQPSCYYEIKELSKDNMLFSIEYENQVFNINSKIIGEYNAFNICAGFVICYNLGIPPDKLVSSIESFPGVEGRFQKVKLRNNSIAIIDYSHSKDSLEKVLNLIKKVYPKKNIITIFGCDGNRSKEKRPLMGKIASEKSKLAIITNGNTREENPIDIAFDIRAGIKKENFKIIVNRREAIRFALRLANNSVVLIAGKGSEEFFESNKNKKPQKDINLLLEEMKKLF